MDASFSSFIVSGSMTFKVGLLIRPTFMPYS